jgi:hypothetical protein
MASALGCVELAQQLYKRGANVKAVASVSYSINSTAFYQLPLFWYYCIFGDAASFLYSHRRSRRATVSVFVC